MPSINSINGFAGTCTPFNEEYCTSTPENLIRCPEQLPTALFSSPVSPLNPAELELLERKIAAANQVLQAIGNPRDPQQLRAFQLKLISLTGHPITIQLESNLASRQRVEGCLQAAGKNYVQLADGDWIIFIPYNQINVLKGGECSSADGHSPHLTRLTQQERESLIRQFGRTVSGNVHLLNIFFGIDMSIGLIPYQGFHVIAVLEDGRTIRGRLYCSGDGHIELCSSGRKKRDRVNLEDINQIKLKKGLSKS